MPNLENHKTKGLLSRTWRITKRVFLVLFVAQLVYIAVLKWMLPPITMTQFGDMVHGWFSHYGFHRHYVRSDQIPRSIRLAVMASEDQLFPDHGGFDWKQIEKAIAYNDKMANDKMASKKKPRIRGGSTISQQTAKNVFLWQGRNWVRKGLEAYFTKMIEWTWGKKRILVTYLNVIQMGQGIYGVEAASQQFFHKPAKQLTRAEAALIAACLPNPVRWHPNTPSRFILERQRWILDQMDNLEGDPDIEALLK